MCTHECLECFFEKLQKAKNLTKIESKRVKRILRYWNNVCHKKSLDLNKQYQLTGRELCVLYLFAAQSVNCNFLSLSHHG